MKKYFLFWTLMLISFSTLVYADPQEGLEGVETSTESENIQILSSDSNEVAVQNVEDVIENKADMANYVSPIKIISGINDEATTGFSKRTSAINWAFALLYILLLREYGQKLKSKKKLEKYWFKKPILIGLVLYIVHAPLHMLLADPIFLIYYFMLMCDIAIAAFFYYYFVLGFGKSKGITTKRARTIKQHS